MSVERRSKKKEGGNCCFYSLYHAAAPSNLPYIPVGQCLGRWSGGVCRALISWRRGRPGEVGPGEPKCGCFGCPSYCFVSLGPQGTGKKTPDYVPAERLNKYFKMCLKVKVRWGQDGSSGLLLWASACPSAWPVPSLWALTRPRPGGRKCKGMTATEMKKNILIRKNVLTNILR